MAENITADTLHLFQERPSVAVLMSGSGTNAINLLGNEQVRDLYDVTAVVSDNPKSQAETIATQFDLPYIEHEAASRLSSDVERNEYFKTLQTILGSRGIEGVFYAGFMKISSAEFTKRFPGINVHPADLTITGTDGLPLYRGMDAMHRMVQDLGYVKATAHIVDSPVDSGTSLSISDALPLEVGESYQALHTRLKTLEHLIYPETLIRMAIGTLDSTQLPVTIRGAEL